MSQRGSTFVLKISFIFHFSFTNCIQEKYVYSGYMLSEMNKKKKDTENDSEDSERKRNHEEKYVDFPRI